MIRALCGGEPAGAVFPDEGSEDGIATKEDATSA